MSKKKQIIFRVSTDSKEYKWYEAQNNKQLSLKNAIDVMINRFGINDLQTELIKYSSSKKVSKFEPTEDRNKSGVTKGKEIKVDNSFEHQIKPILYQTSLKSKSSISDDPFDIPGLS